MLSPEEFEEEYAGRLDAELPNRPISSLRDIQYLYGRLYTMATAGGGEFAAYLTPDEANDLEGEPESLIVLRVDIGEDGTATLPEAPVFVTSLNRSLVPKIAHCDFDASAGIDHSITHRTGQDKTPEEISDYLVERLTRWAVDEVVVETAAEHEDGWIIESLASLGDSEDISDRVREATLSQLDGSTTALTSVAVRLPGDNSYRYPGELDTEAVGELRTDVFQDAMRARKLSKFVDKNAATDSAGEAVDLISGQQAKTVGMAEDPLNFFLGKQMESFPALNPDEAWRSHPLGEDTAVTLINAQPFVDACSYRALNMRVYYLPYFYGRPTPEKGLELYNLLYSVYDESDLTPVEQAYQVMITGSSVHIPSDLELRFYIGAIRYQQAKRFDVFGDSLDGALHYPVELSNAHQSVLTGPVFSAEKSGRTPPLPTNSDWDLLSPGNQLGSIASGWYLTETFPWLGADEDPSSEDYRIQSLVNILSGTPIQVDELLSQYTDRLIEDEGDNHPSLTVASQFAQLTALADVGLLTAGSEEYEPLTVTSTYTPMTENGRAQADGGSSAVARREKLASFIDNTPAISEDPQRRSAFLLGALIGQVSSYQEAAENRATTLIDQYPIKGMTVGKFKRTLEEALDKNIVYARDNRMSGTMYAEVVEQLRGAVGKSGEDPGEWSIDTTDLRFYYSLGVSYGMNDYSPGKSDDESSADQTSS